MKHYVDKMNSQFGSIVIVVDENKVLKWLYISNKEPDWMEGHLKKKFGDIEWSPKKCSHVSRQMNEYCEGKRKTFDLKYELDGTEFRERVWDELTRIPYGTTINYGELAKRIGQPKAMRAVGQANRNNPIMVIIPCHRVVKADGTVVGPDKNSTVREDLIKHEAKYK